MTRVKHLTNFMRGYKETNRCCIDSIIEAERFEKRLKYLNSESSKRARKMHQEHRHKERVDAITHNIKVENYCHSRYVRTYLSMYKEDTSLAEYVNIIIGQFRKGRITQLRQTLLDKLREVKKKYHETLQK